MLVDALLDVSIHSIMTMPMFLTFCAWIGCGGQNFEIGSWVLSFFNFAYSIVMHSWKLLRDVSIFLFAFGCPILGFKSRAWQ